MSEGNLLKKLTEICGKTNISTDPSLLKIYSSDLSLVEGKIPICVVWVSSVQIVEKILRLANDLNFTIVPVSSSSKYRHHGDTLPKKENCVILNLSRMKKIISIDRKNRVAMVEPGVTFEELILELKKKGLRLLMPLHPTGAKSVLTSALEREPTIIPRYHWDSSDPLLCTEVVFGTGDLFRTGTAAGPGTIKEQQKSGQAQVNPMGPTQFSPFRIIQGAQGSMGVVTWATLKLELIPSIQKVFHLQSDNLQELMELQHELIKYRLCDEIFVLNSINLACLLRKNELDIRTLANSLLKWNLIYIIAGRGKLTNDKLAYLEGDIQNIMHNLKINNTTNFDVVNESDIIKVINETAAIPWRTKLGGGYQDIFFLTNLEKIPEFISIVEKEISKDLGIYIQAINQGTSYHCEFDLYNDKFDSTQKEELRKRFLDISVKLMEAGAFFNRPYGLWAKEVFKRHDNSTQVALKKVKKIFDPKNILNPGVLCFDNDS